MMNGAEQVAGANERPGCWLAFGWLLGGAHRSAFALAAMSARVRHIMWCMVSLAMLLIGGAMLIRRSVSGTSELPREDVIQIRTAVRHEIWRKVVPLRWSRAILQRLPGELWRTGLSKVSPASSWEHKYDDRLGYCWRVEVVDREGYTYDLLYLQKKGNRWVVVASMRHTSIGTEANHSMQPTGASHSGQYQLCAQRRLAPAADADRWASVPAA
jgi:hypothetical protein